MNPFTIPILPAPALPPAFEKAARLEAEYFRSISGITDHIRGTVSPLPAPAPLIPLHTGATPAPPTSAPISITGAGSSDSRRSLCPTCGRGSLIEFVAVNVRALGCKYCHATWVLRQPGDDLCSICGGGRYDEELTLCLRCIAWALRFYLDLDRGAGRLSLCRDSSRQSPGR